MWYVSKTWHHFIRQDVTWLVDWGSVSGCVVPASPETDPAGSPLVLDLSNHESLWRRGNSNVSHTDSNSCVFIHHNPVGLTWLEEHDGLEAGELCGIDSEGLEAAEDLLQEAQVQAGVAVFSLHAGAEVGQGEKRAAVQRQGPLDGAEQEELAPRLLQQDHLARRSFSMRPKV